jgi:hypothetical protein
MTRSERDYAEEQDYADYTDYRITGLQDASGNVYGFSSVEVVASRSVWALPEPDSEQSV